MFFIENGLINFYWHVIRILFLLSNMTYVHKRRWAFSCLWWIHFSVLPVGCQMSDNSCLFYFNLSSAVYKQSTYNKAYKEGMEVNCKYVKRKQLSNYLSQDVLDRYKCKSEEGQPRSIGQKRKSDPVLSDFTSRDSPESNKKVKRDSENLPQVRLSSSYRITWCK